MRRFLEKHPAPGVWQGDFIDRMDRAYASADVVVSRSGSCSVSELWLVGKPTLFVPSPNVAEDHPVSYTHLHYWHRRKRAVLRWG